MARLWIIGLAIEALLMLTPMVWARVAPRAPSSPATRELEAYKAHMDSADRGLLPPPTPLSDSARSALRTMFRDSLGFDLVQRGETTAIVPRTAQARALSNRVAHGLERMGVALRAVVAGLLVMAAVIYLSIPLALTAVTAVCLWQRERVDVGAGTPSS